MGKGRQPAQSNVSAGLPEYVDRIPKAFKGFEELQCRSTLRLVSLLTSPMVKSV